MPLWEVFEVPGDALDFTGNLMPDRTTSPEIPVDYLSTRDGYDRWAVCYDADDNPLVAIEAPLMRHLLGDVRGCSVADIGCGTGRHAVWLAAAGASVQALDFSEAMLARARAKAGAANIVFRAHDLSQPLPFPDQAFDRVVCGLVVDHIADLGGLFREMHRVCQPTGAVIVSVMHPAMMLLGSERCLSSTNHYLFPCVRDNLSSQRRPRNHRLERHSS
jgi:ubiquinone/menaquinone biosynthesis C-methylase UbiE